MTDSIGEALPVPLLGEPEAHERGQDQNIAENIASLSLFRVLLQNERVAGAIGNLLQALLVDGVLDPRLRELVVMRLAWRYGAEYQWSHHWRISRGAYGIPADDLLAVRDPIRPDGFSAAERAALKATDEMMDDHRIGTATWADLREHLPSEAERVELVVLIGTYLFFPCMLNALHVPLEESMRSWPPDGLTPNR